MQEQKNKQQPQTSREGGDDALSNLESGSSQGHSAEEIGYTNEERVAEDGEGPNMPRRQDDDPAGSGIPSKE